jgi:hypothetical protein
MDIEDMTNSDYENKFIIETDEEMEEMEEIDKLNNMKDTIQLRDKLGTYVKTELHKLMTFLKVGRKYNDNKTDCLEKLFQYFVDKI